MITSSQPMEKPRITRQTKRYVGKVVFMYAFDVAYEMTRQPVRELLGHPLAQFSVDASKRSPKQLFFYRPQMVRLPPLERIGPRGPVRLDRSEEHTSELQSLAYLVCRLLLEKKKIQK